MNSHKLYVCVNGKEEELRPISAIQHPIVETDNVSVDCSELGREMSVSFKTDEGMKRFKGQMEKEFSVVDITDWPVQMIKKLIFTFPRTSKLITRNPDHYFALQMEDGFSCVAGGYDTLYDLPLILDKKGKIKAAKVMFKKKGGGTDADER